MRPQISLARASLAWGLATLFFGYIFMQRVSPSVMVGELMRDFAVGAALLGHLSAFYFYAYAGLQIPVGLVLDRAGPRLVMALSAAVCGGGSLLFALSPSIELAYLGRLLIGAGAAFSWVGSLTLAAQLFPPRRFALLVGIGQLVGMLGGVLAQAPLGFVVQAIGWRHALAAGAAIAFVLAVAMWWATPTLRGPPRRAGSVLADLRRVAAQRQTWIIAGTGFALTGPMMAFAGLWAVPYLVSSQGLSRDGAAGTASLLFVGWALGAPLVGWLSDRLHRRRVLLILGTASGTAALSAILYLPGLSLTAVSMLLIAYGISGSTMVLTFAAAREANPSETSGLAMGLLNTAVSGAGAVLQPLIGHLLDYLWDGQILDGARVYGTEAFRTALTVLPVICVFGLIGALLLREAPLPTPEAGQRP